MAKVQLNVWLDERDRDEMRRLAAARGVSLGQLVRDAVLGSRVDGASEVLEDHERRLASLEELAQRSAY